MKSRIIFVYFALVFFYAFFIVRGALLQFFPDDRLISAQKRNFETSIQLKPRRGTIYDRHGRELAITVSSHSLFADPSLIKFPKVVAKKLARILKIPSHLIYKKIRNKRRRFVWLKRHIKDKDWDKIRSWKLSGLAVLEEPKRVYPNGSLIAQTLGFVGHDGYGLEGVELSYDKVLSGEEKKVLVQKDAMGRPLFVDTIKDLINFKGNGADIYLTIDSDLQFFFEKELRKVKKTYSAHSALGLIMKPQTGEILAMAHVPSFNLNNPFQSQPQLFRNRSITDAFEPGSTFKPFVIATALKKNIPPSKSYDGMGGRLVVGGHTIKEAESTYQFENLTLREILSHSSNIGSAQVALDVGTDFLYQSLKEFGFGSKLGFQLAGESSGILNQTPWTKLQLATIGFGHSITTTPLQMVTAYSAIANGGILKQPYLVKSISDPKTGEKENFEPRNIRTVLTPREAKAITVMLISAVSDKGTGWRAKVKGFLVAGKTGTAQVVDSKKGGYIKGQYIASFAGFIPAHDPRFTIYVVVDRPQKKFYGSRVAAPVFANVAEYAVRRSGASPIIITEENILKTKKKKKDKKKITDRGLAFNIGDAPNFVGLALRKAYQLARESRIQLVVKGSGRVVRMIPSSGKSLPKNRTVRLILK